MTTRDQVELLVHHLDGGKTGGMLVIAKDRLVDELTRFFDIFKDKIEEELCEQEVRINKLRESMSNITGMN